MVVVVVSMSELPSFNVDTYIIVVFLLHFVSVEMCNFSIQAFFFF